MHYFPCYLSLYLAFSANLYKIICTLHQILYSHAIFLCSARNNHQTHFLEFINTQNPFVPNLFVRKSYYSIQDMLYLLHLCSESHRAKFIQKLFYLHKVVGHAKCQKVLSTMIRLLSSLFSIQLALCCQKIGFAYALAL